MKTLEELKAAAEAATIAYAQAKAEVRASKLEEVKALIKEFDFSPNEIFKQKTTRLPKSESATKTLVSDVYEKDGKKWSGKGRPPKWVVAAKGDGSLEKYRIA